MDGAGVLKLFKLLIILTLVLKQKNNAKINGFLKLLMCWLHSNFPNVEKVPHLGHR